MTRVLIVDDDPGICEFVELLLTDEGYEVQCAHHGADALRVLSHFQPDIMLVDMRMPVMNGAEFLRIYYESPGPHARVVIMTAAHDMRRIAVPGTTEVLEKPFQVAELLDRLAHERHF